MSRTFVEKPPVLEPEMIKVKVPSSGTDKDTVVLKIANPCDERVIYRITGTRIDKFNIEALQGFVEPKNTTNVEMIPKKMKNADGFNKFDHFVVETGAPAPKGDMWKAAEVWKSHKPKDLKTYKIQLKVSDGKDEPEAGAGSGEGSGESSGEE